MKKLVCVVFIIVALPLFGALASGSRHLAQAFNSVAIAGHSTAGGSWCTCGCQDCICDPGEVPVMCGESATVALSNESGLMLVLFALALAARFAMRR